MSLMFKCSWEMLFFESEDTEGFKADRNKLVASNENQTDKFIPYCSTCYTQTCQLCVPTIVKVSFMKNIFWCGCCSLLIFVAKKALKGINFNFYVHKTPSKVEE